MNNDYTFRALDTYGDTIDARTFDGNELITEIIGVFRHFNEDPKFIVQDDTEEVIWSADGKSEVPFYTPREKAIQQILDEIRS